MSIAYPSDSIWIPGAGQLRFSELQAARAVEDYDSDLTLGEYGGQWAVFLPRTDGEGVFPVLGLGHDLPAPERIKELLYKHDVRRNGRAILDEMERHADRADKEFADKTSDAAGAVAEAIASHMNAEGTHPFPTIHMGGRKPGNVRSSG